MTSLGERGYLADVNVWIALASDRHQHHDSARRWFDSCIAAVVFCRITQLAFLRLLTNPKVMGDEALNPSDAVAVYRRLVADERVFFTPEPSKIEDAWISLMTIRSASGSTWTDAYLAAFAMTAYCGVGLLPAICPPLFALLTLDRFPDLPRQPRRRKWLLQEQ